MKPARGVQTNTAGNNDSGCKDRRRRYYTTSQLARRWGVSSVTVIRLIDQGDLNGLKIRGSYRISDGSIQDYESRVAF